MNDPLADVLSRSKLIGGRLIWAPQHEHDLDASDRVRNRIALYTHVLNTGGGEPWP